MKAVWLIALLGLFSMSTMAKGGDTSIWRSFELIASKGNINTGSLRVNLPSAQDGSLADLLNRNSALFVKYYSPGSLASTSMRGMGAQHTAILWNGINLQSSMNGILDLNLLPLFFIDKAALETGANASNCGSGAIAGAIVLSNDTKESNKVFGEFSAGSFSQRNLGLGISIKLKALFLNTRYLSRYAENDFEFINVFKVNQPIEKIQNNRFMQNGLMQELSFSIGIKHHLYINYWYLETKRQLPTAMGVSLSAKEHQDDYNTFTVLKHEAKLNPKCVLNNKLSFNSETINYFNLFLPDAYNKARSFFAESELKYNLSRQFELLMALNNTYQIAWTDGYRRGIDRNLSSAFVKLNWTNKTSKLKLSMANRQLLNNGKWAPVTPDFGFDWLVHKRMKWKSNAAYSFRLPSFNDLYWQGGGNPNLLPERGKKLESSIEIKRKEFKMGFTGFFHQVQNWILWVPFNGASTWMAANAKEIESKGIECMAETKWSYRKTQLFKFYARYQYVLSINKAVYGADQSTVGKQLFYTPKHTAIANLQYISGKYRTSINTTYTGQRFAYADNRLDGLLPAFTLVNLAFARNIYYKQFKSSIEFSVLNVLNSNYMVFENRPMPKRNYLLTFKYNINYE